MTSNKELVFIDNCIKLNRYLELLLEGCGDWTKESMTEAEFRRLLAERIDQINMERAKEDIKRFIKDPNVLDIWSPSYFHKLVEQLKINSKQPSFKCKYINLF